MLLLTDIPLWSLSPVDCYKNQKRCRVMAVVD
ncbi:unnamed protein product [Arabidopsis thaliana]|uniref:Uncharacterized protein n=2 Tax=Arabidopsis thaliana TaxID=3702 RepID=A0A654EYP9_ARATH|nr:uncharacterized protein AT2G34186 [Arabidopsis thaliana]AEC08933.1 hypothetical protein AT2G34186 [Arabidopsis thaliana]CAA0374509.1 unnamed protein product [Arabidopsis thaliana]VYS54396.1 unnamed protein product [Arabidopsis thaliana]|eukprot:NP_001118438.1 hypothetical protein AT2G34186 [Arabidopsis thaliana]